MTEFVGRTGSKRVYSYPENARAAALSSLARNFASGPKNTTEISGGGIQIPWNAVESPIKFTVDAGGITVSIVGDVRDSFTNTDVIVVVPLTPAPLAPVSLTVASVPAFAAGVTTFNLSAPIDATTTGGFIFDVTSGTVDVPITPRATGILLVSGVVTFINGSGSPVAVATVQVALNGVAQGVPFDLQVGPLADGDTITIPFMAELILLTVGTTYYVEIIVTGDGLDLLGEDSALSIQEVSFATG
jgi:hypothetical protein